MKKCLIIIVAVSLIAFMVALFSGCSQKVEDNEANISDIRYGIFDGQCESYTATFVYGMRENPYLADGIANSKVEFGIISVIFAEKISDNETVSFLLKINDDNISGTLEKSPFTDEYMADIGTICENTDNLSLTISLNSNDNAEADQFIILQNKNTAWELNYDEAFENGITTLANEIKDIIDNDCTYEIHTKIITEQQSNFGTYFWAVSIISSSGAKHTVVFTPYSKQILVKN